MRWNLIQATFHISAWCLPLLAPYENWSKLFLSARLNFIADRGLTSVPNIFEHTECRCPSLSSLHNPPNMAVTGDKLSYGWLRFRPTWLQFLNTPKWFLFFLSQYFFTQSIVVNGVYPGSISTIEKRFGFSRLVCSSLCQPAKLRIGFLIFPATFIVSK